MNMFLSLCVMLLIAAGSTTALGKNVTFYADGTIVELEGSAHKGIFEVPLPSALIEGSLRVKPGSGTSIKRVEILSIPPDTGKAGKELDTLLEQKNRLGDRMLALTTREEIFKSAAKSQSAKAPRKSKTNPEPMQSIRQGTEFAIAQLEAVYTARRKTEQEIRRIDSRIAAAKSTVRGSERFARIMVSPTRGNVMIRFAVDGQSWTPSYDIFLNGTGSAQVNLSGQFPVTYAGYQLQASPGLLADSTSARVFPLQSGPANEVARYKLAVAEELFETGLLPSFTFVLKNLEQSHLPAGEANIYRNGEYMARLRFDGLSSGRSRRVSVGR